MLQDEFYVKHLAEKKVLGPVLDVLLRTMPRDNLLCSACLDLFALISKEHIKELIKHLVEGYREKVMALGYLDIFRDIIHQYDHSQGYTASGDTYFIESEDELGRRPPNHGARSMMEHLAVDPAQEEYWNTSDDEEENVVRSTPDPAATTNGAALKPLVEYTSDEEAEEGGDAVMTGSPSLPLEDASKENKEPTTPGSASGAATPPERLSEKRRREEDDDDALDKLVHHKRRNSNAVSGNSNNLSPVGLRRKKSLRDASPNGPGPKKIAITISSSVKTATVKASGGEEETK